MNKKGEGNSMWVIIAFVIAAIVLISLIYIFRVQIMEMFRAFSNILKQVVMGAEEVNITEMAKP